MSVIFLSPENFFVLLVLVILLAAFLLYRLIERRDNRLEWADLIATRGALNAYKIGYWVGVNLGAWVVIKQTLTNHLDAGAFAAWLAFVGGVTAITSMAGKERPKHGVDDPDGEK